MEDQKKEIFQDVMKVLKKFKKGMKERTDGKTKYELSGTKKVHAYNKDIDGMYFVSLVIQKGLVGFYFFPQYANPKLLAVMPDNLKKYLKGKSCFHLKKRDPEIYKSIKEYVQKGYD